MEMKEYTDVQVDLKELLAEIVRGGKTIIAVALALALVFGAVGMLSYALNSDPDDAYLAEMEEYELQKQELEAALEKAQRDAASQKEYYEQSCLMQIDPYNKITTTVIFAISGVELEGVTDSFDITEIPISYITSRIQAQYMVLWNSMNLKQIVAGTQYSGIGDKYLREVILLTAAEGGVLTLTVDGNDAQSCEQIAQIVYTALLQSREAVVKGSYDHQLAMLSEPVTKSSIDWKLEQTQLDSKAKLERQKQSVTDCEKKLTQLREPSYNGGIAGVVIDVIIGGVIGVVLAMIWLVIRSFVKGCVSGAKQMSGRYGLLHFGSLMKKAGLWEKLGDRVMGEKRWKDGEQAGSYIRQNSQSHLTEGSAVVVVSTLAVVEEEIQKELAALLGANGQKVTFVTDAAHSPEALAAMTQCDGIVLAERAFVSRNVAVRDVLNTAKSLNKPVCGFVLV